MLTIWPIRGLETVSGRCWIMEIWSKVKVTLISQSRVGRRSVVLPGRPRQLWYFSLKSVSREDVHLTQFWSILTKQSRGSGLCLFWPATTAVSWSDFQASHWSSRYRECLSLAADVTGKLWPQVIQLFDFCPLSPLSLCSLYPHPCALCGRGIIISSYLCFRGNFLTVAWYHRLSSVTQIRGDCEKRSRGHVTFYSNNFVHHQHNIPGSRWKMISEI